MNVQRFVAGLFAAILAGAMAAPPAQAFPPPGTPITTDPGALFGGGVADTIAIYAYADAGDRDQLLLSPDPTTIFDNKVNSPGDAVNLGVLSGPQVFGLRDLSVVDTFLTNVPDANGEYHAYYAPTCDSIVTCSAAYLSFFVGDLGPAITAVIGGLPAGTDVVFVGWEDRVGGDWDFNDLIFALTNLQPATVLDRAAIPGPAAIPEPASIALLGAALLGYGAMARRRNFV